MATIALRRRRCEEHGVLPDVRAKWYPVRPPGTNREPPGPLIRDRLARCTSASSLARLSVPALPNCARSGWQVFAETSTDEVQTPRTGWGSSSTAAAAIRSTIKRYTDSFAATASGRSRRQEDADGYRRHWTKRDPRPTSGRLAGICSADRRRGRCFGTGGDRQSQIRRRPNSISQRQPVYPDQERSWSRRRLRVRCPGVVSGIQSDERTQQMSSLGDVLP